MKASSVVVVSLMLGCNSSKQKSMSPDARTP